MDFYDAKVNNVDFGEIDSNTEKRMERNNPAAIAISWHRHWYI